MANPDAGTSNNNLSTPIADQTPEKLEATWLQLLAKWEGLTKQQAELARQREDGKRVEALRGREHQVNNTLYMHEKDNVPLFPTPGHNLITATMVAHAINLPKGTSGHYELYRPKILMEEIAHQ